MNANRTLTNRFALSVTAASVALGALVGLDPQQARATTELDSDRGTQQTEFQIPKLLDAATPKLSEVAVNGTYSAVGEPSGGSGAKGGNVEFEWKVEEGESAPVVIDDLEAPSRDEPMHFEIQVTTSDLQNAENVRSTRLGVAAGNIEFEWTVEEGEN